MRIQIMRGVNVEGATLAIGALVDLPAPIAGALMQSGKAIPAPPIEPTEEAPKRKRRPRPASTAEAPTSEAS